MKPKNPEFATEVRRLFADAPFISNLGIKLITVAPGKCETVLELEPRHLQQDGFVHAGVQATIADHTAGAAAATLIGSDELVLTAEFKINFLRAAKGQMLRCISNVLKAGTQLTVVESEVFCEDAENRKMVSKATVTIAVVKQNSE